MVDKDDGSDLVGTPTRTAQRPPLREESSQARAARRVAELHEHMGDVEEGTDEFYIAKSDIPPGWDYEWKRLTVLGAEDPAYQVALFRAGWEPVPASRHPSYMPMSGDYETITRKGMILMERPAEINEEARAREQRKAKQQVQQKEAQLNSAPAGEFERVNKDRGSMVKLTKSYEAIPIPE